MVRVLTRPLRTPQRVGARTARGLDGETEDELKRRFGNGIAT
jgi:hypothetical protein